MTILTLNLAILRFTSSYFYDPKFDNSTPCILPTSFYFHHSDPHEVLPYPDPSPAILKLTMSYFFYPVTYKILPDSADTLMCPLIIVLQLEWQLVRWHS